jgi:hypothetical protein
MRSPMVCYDKAANPISFQIKRTKARDYLSFLEIFLKSNFKQSINGIRAEKVL